MSAQVALRDVTFGYAHRPVLGDVTCAFTPGAVTGVVGENGSGKSTLLRLLAGLDRPARGQVTVRADGGAGYLAQDSPLPGHLTVDQVVDDALAELRAIQARLRELEAAFAAGPARDEDLREYGELLTWFEARDGYGADSRVRQAMAGLGLGDLPGGRRLRELSGGQQARLHLAALLSAGPEVLLLDEPTNHLDAAATGWLESHLAGRTGTAVLVSHDRVLLDRVASALVEVDADTYGVTRYPGGYAAYLAARTAARQRAVAARADWEAEVERLRSAITTTAPRVAPGRLRADNDKMGYGLHGMRVQASVSSRVRNARERLDRLERRPVPIPPTPLRFAATPAVGGLAAGLVAAVGVTVAGRLAPVSLDVPAGGRLLVTGPNGAGKTTLLQVLAGELPPDGGRVVRRGRVGCLAQETPPGRADLTVLEAFAAGRVGTPGEHGAALGRLGLLPPSTVHSRVGALSTGQRRRLALARLVADPVDVLLLDEPTNHLSPGLVEDLEAALERYAGALVVVSHDRLLRARWRGPVLALAAVGGALAA